MTRGPYRPTANGLAMLESLKRTGNPTAHLDSLVPWEAKMRHTAARWVREALMRHGLIAHTRERGLYVTLRGRVAIARAHRNARIAKSRPRA